jgi:glycosyltransferase involved in cell wall biosynthesis
VKVANQLYINKQIKGIITFGENYYYDKFIHPQGLIKHYSNATQEEIKDIFNMCSCFLMPSISEGINLTPIESTLCGCPAIICDGAIDEIFYHGNNCFIAKKDNILEMNNLCINVINHFNDYSLLFLENMKEVIKQKTWEKVINNIINIL